jgi:hypothetical protein
MLFHCGTRFFSEPAAFLLSRLDWSRRDLRGLFVFGICTVAKRWGADHLPIIPGLFDNMILNISAEQSCPSLPRYPGHGIHYSEVLLKRHTRDRTAAIV